MTFMTRMRTKLQTYERFHALDAIAIYCLYNMKIDPKVRAPVLLNLLNMCNNIYTNTE